MLNEFETHSAFSIQNSALLSVPSFVTTTRLSSTNARQDSDYMPTIRPARTGGLPVVAGLSTDGCSHRGHQPLRSADHRSVCRYVDCWHPARNRLQLRRRGALRRNAVTRELVDDQLQRNEHLRERLPQRVPRRAGQSARQHRRRPRRYVRVHRRAGTAPLPMYLAFFHGATGASNNSASTRRRTSRTTRS